MCCSLACGEEVTRPIFLLTCRKTLAFSLHTCMLRVARMGGRCLSQVAHSGQEAGCLWERSGCDNWRPRGITCRGGSRQLSGGRVVVVVVNRGWLLLFSSQDSVVHPSLVLAEHTARSGLQYPFPGPKVVGKAAECVGGPAGTPAALPVPLAEDW